MTTYPDLSKVPPEVASDGLLNYLFAVRESPPKPFELELPPPHMSREIGEGLAYANVWGSGPVVLFVHGWGGRHTQFAGMIARAVAGGQCAVALEMPGHGRARNVQSNPLTFSRAVQSAADYFGPFVSIAGHSQGGNAVMHAVSAGVVASHLVMIAPAVSIAGVLQMMCRYVNATDETTALFLSKVQASVGVPASDFEGSTLAPKIRIPVLIIHDRKDQELPFTPSKKLAGILPKADFMATDGLGHIRILNDSDVIDKVTKFASQTQICLISATSDIHDWDETKE